MIIKGYINTRAVLLVLSFFCVIVCASYTSYAQQKQPVINTITYKGNVFEIMNSADTFLALDPVTNEVGTVIENPNPIPLKLNNMNIYSKGDVEKHPSVKGTTLRNYILQTIGKQLSDGEYRLLLSNVILNEKGKIVYYSYDGLEKKTGTSTKKDATITTKIIDNLIDKTPAYKPAIVYNNPVPYRLPDTELQQPFRIRNGTIQ